MRLGHLPGACRVRALSLAVPAVVVLAALAPTAAVADTMSLALDTEAVQNEATQVTYNAETEGEGFVTLALNPGSVPCGSTPEEDPGTTIVEPQLLTEPQSGAFTGSASFTPAQPGAFLVCGWVTGWAKYDIKTGGPELAAASLPIEVRPPHISLALSLPSAPVAGRSFTLDLTATSEVAREAIVVGVPATPAGCPADPAATGASHLIDATITGGPVLKSAVVDGLSAGSRWVFCAWAVVPGESTPQASSSLVAEVPGARQVAPRPRHGQKRKRGLKRKHKHGQGASRRSRGERARGDRTRGRGGRERACGTLDLGNQYTETIHASGISCAQARVVAHAAEHMQLPNDVAQTPYFKYSPPYSVDTPAGRFTCRFEPFGLAGTEHNIRCVRAHPLARVRWYTTQD
jgi:hypothetical protein